MRERERERERESMFTLYSMTHLPTTGGNAQVLVRNSFQRQALAWGVAKNWQFLSGFHSAGASLWLDFGASVVGYCEQLLSLDVLPTKDSCIISLYESFETCTILVIYYNSNNNNNNNNNNIFY